MPATMHIEMREGEQWRDVANAFMRYCLDEKKTSTGGCHQGDPMPIADGKRYAAISVPAHSACLINYLSEWALRERRNIKQNDTNA